MYERAIEIAVKAARRAGRIMLEGLKRTVDVHYKGNINLVTDIDIKCESAIKEIIRHEFPTHAILAEESDRDFEEREFCWIIDPLDGTTNYAHKYPFFCVSIALTRHMTPVAGVVFNPVSGELFRAERGKGAYLNGNKLEVSRVKELDRSFLCTGFAYNIRETSDNNLDHFASFVLKAQAVRRDGAAALDLCFVGSGRFDGFWELNLHAWDVAAGILVIEEAGGKVTELTGNQYSIFSKSFVASNGLIHDQMLEVIKENIERKLKSQTSNNKLQNFKT